MATENTECTEKTLCVLIRTKRICSVSSVANNKMSQDLFGNSAKNKLDRMAAAMRTLHKALIDQTQREYERSHGKVTSPYTLFALVTSDPAFAWLQPMTRLIVEMEDLVGRKEKPPTESEVAEMRKRIDGLLESKGEAFSDKYLGLLQSSPEIAVENGKLRATLRGL